ncbi:MAG: hypothetical protein AAF914_15205, partial [Pseudomonadota bacterium]
MTIRYAVLGLDDPSVLSLAHALTEAGATAAAWWTQGEPAPLAAFLRAHPGAARTQIDDLLAAPDLPFVLIAAAAKDRADLATQSLAAGKHVLVTGPGCLTEEDLGGLRLAQQSARRVWAVSHANGRWTDPSLGWALAAAEDGVIGALRHVGMRLSLPRDEARPDLLAGHAGLALDAFLALAGTQTAEITHAAGKTGAPWSEVSLRAGPLAGHIRTDRLAPDGTGAALALDILGEAGRLSLSDGVDGARRLQTVTPDGHRTLPPGDTAPPAARDFL